MKILETVKDIQVWRKKQEREHSIGFVPTMGALHEGHISLIERSKSENNVTVVSIFLNPTQFDNPEDLLKYPDNRKQDLEMLKTLQVDVLFLPNSKSIYPLGYHYKIVEDEKSNTLCGSNRKGHFDGVLTIVLKLLNLVSPTKIYLGEKDFQQLTLIQGMIDDFFLDTKVVACPIIRSDVGVALSSRNQRLTPDGLEKASTFASILKNSHSLPEVKEKLTSAGIKIDYLEEKWGRRFAAVHIDPVRLIDNVEI